MSRVFKKSNWADGDVLTPHELNAELITILGEFNGNLDRDNFGPNLITEAKFKKDTFNMIEVLEGSDTPTTKVEGPHNQAPKLHHIPLSNSVDKTSISMQTGDGGLQIEACIGWQHLYMKGDGSTGRYYNNTSEKYYMKHAGQVMICLVVDGKIVARSGTMTPFIQQCRYVTAYKPVGAGTHTIEVMAYIFTGRDSNEPANTGTTESLNTGASIKWITRNLWARHIRR